MAVQRLMYVSHSRLGAADENEAVAAILAAAHRHNVALGVTGALIYSGTHFVQLLEGHQSSVGAIFDRLAADPRHTDIDVISSAPSPTRLFAGWSMAYRGKTQYVQSRVDQLVDERDRVSIVAFERLMLEFATAGGIDRTPVIGGSISTCAKHEDHQASIR